MTAASAAAAPAASGLRLPLAFSIALRELRAGAGGLTVFVLCIALGVAAVAAIGSLAASFEQALTRQGRLSDRRRSRLRADQPPSQRRRARGARCAGPGERIGELPRHGPRLLRQDRTGRGEGRRRRLPALWRGRGARAGGCRRRLALSRRGAGRTRLARSARRRDRQPAHHRRGQRHHRRRPRRSARPARRSSRLWAEAADVARDAGAHRAVAARQPDSLDLSRRSFPNSAPRTRRRSRRRAKASRANSRKAASPPAIGPIPRRRSAATPTASPNSSASSG